MRKVTVVGAGKYGSTTVQRIAEADLVDEVDDRHRRGLPQGLALDMNQARPSSRYRTVVVGSNDYADTAGSDVVVITAGLPRRPGMSRMDLLEANAKIVKGVTEEVAAGSPEAVIIVVTNPLDHMTTLAADVSGLPPRPGDGAGWDPGFGTVCPFHRRSDRERHPRSRGTHPGQPRRDHGPRASHCTVGGRPLIDVPRRGGDRQTGGANP